MNTLFDRFLPSLPQLLRFLPQQRSHRKSAQAVEAWFCRRFFFGFILGVLIFHVIPSFAQTGDRSVDPFIFETLQKKKSLTQDPLASGSPFGDLNQLTSEEINQGKALLQDLPPRQKQGRTSDLQQLKNSQQLKKIRPDKNRKNKKNTDLQSTEDQPLSGHSDKPMPSVRLKKNTLDLEEMTSPFESHLQSISPSTIPFILESFGYDLFSQSSSTFVPVDTVPVEADYLLGPGDETRITVWGKINADFVKTIGRDGMIVLPQLGAIHLAGLTFSEAKDFIKKEFSRYYKPSEVKINVSMGRLRTLQVFIVGKAQRPGSYTLSSFSTLVNALFASGGPSPIGSMRDIQLKRHGKTITHFDLYDFLLKGEKERDLRLMSGDVIFIPTVGPRVGISGHVKVPALYEIKGEITLREMIAMAGGVNATGYLQQVQIERIFGNVSKIVLDINLNALNALENQSDVPLRDGDLVKVFSIDQRITNTVTLKGNVVRPGIFEWREGMRIQALFHDLDDFLPETFLEYALIERLVPPDDHKEYLSVGLLKLLLEGDQNENVLLKPDDKVVVFNRWDLIGKKRVQLSGAVNKPGSYEYRPNMKISDLFKLAGGLKRPDHPESYLPDGIVVRRMPPDFHEEKITFNLVQAIIAQDASGDLFLQPLDKVYLFDQWELSQEKVVRIDGAVNKPGVYDWAENLRIGDLLNLSGGTKYYAFLESAELTRITPTPLGPKMKRISIALKEVLSGNPRSNILLQADDYISVKSVPEWELYRTVLIEGEVRFPGTYTSQKGETLSSLIERAGGVTKNAYLKGAVFTRKSVQKLQQRQLDDMIDRLEQQLLSQSAATIESALTPEAALQHKASTGQRNALIAKMRAARATGRLSIHLTPMETFKGTPSDLVLEEGDLLFIPEQPQQIQVVGAVFNQTAFIFDADKTVSEYLDQAGGMREAADEDALYILKVNGTAVSRQQKRGFWQKKWVASTLNPGDTIVVPEEIERIVWLREVKDITQILYQMAVTAGVLIVAF